MRFHYARGCGSGPMGRTEEERQLGQWFEWAFSLCTTCNQRAAADDSASAWITPGGSRRCRRPGPELRCLHAGALTPS